MGRLTEHMIEPGSYEAPFEFDFEPAYTVADYSDGIAWRAYGYESVPDEDTEWSGFEQPTGKILLHMVGDDRRFAYDPTDLTPIADEDYCSCCGQVGCAWGVVA